MSAKRCLGARYSFFKLSSKNKNGVVRETLTSRSLIRLILTPCQLMAAGDLNSGSLIFSIVKIMSSAVTGVPSCQRAFSLRRICQVRKFSVGSILSAISYALH